MKKLLTVLLVGLMVFGSIGSVFANEGFGEDEILEQKLEGFRFKGLKEFKEERHVINDLRIERLKLRIEVIEINDEIADLVLEAVEEKNIEALKEAKAVREEVKVINEELKGLHNSIKTEKSLFKEAMSNKDLGTAKTHLDNIIELLKELNQKIENRIELLDVIIKIL